MMTDMAMLERVLEMSVEKHGKDKPITLGHLLNLIKLAAEIQEAQEQRIRDNQESPHQ